jgi:hypothetical protein
MDALCSICRWDAPTPVDFLEDGVSLDVDGRMKTFKGQMGDRPSENIIYCDESPSFAETKPGIWTYCLISTFRWKTLPWRDGVEFIVRTYQMQTRILSFTQFNDHPAPLRRGNFAQHCKVTWWFGGFLSATCGTFPLKKPPGRHVTSHCDSGFPHFPAAGWSLNYATLKTLVCIWWVLVITLLTGCSIAESLRKTRFLFETVGLWQGFCGWHGFSTNCCCRMCCSLQISFICSIWISIAILANWKLTLFETHFLQIVIPLSIEVLSEWLFQSITFTPHL